MLAIFRDFTFDSAHYLPQVPEGHKCRNMHGHTYRLRIILEGSLDPELGWIHDFAVVKRIMTPILDQVDHKLLNDISGLENPTCEHLAIWLWNRIKPELPQLSRIELNETPTSGVMYAA